MPKPKSVPLEDYALLSDQHTAALVSRTGSVDWMCVPRFDSAALFSAILGHRSDGRWKLSIRDGEVASRRYLNNTFVLETIWHSPTGKARVLDFMTPNNGLSDLIRRVECLEGTVEAHHEMRLRFNYGQIRPWLRPVDAAPLKDSHLAEDEAGLVATGGPDGVVLYGRGLEYDERSVDPEEDPSGAMYEVLSGSASLSAGERADWSLTWFKPWDTIPARLDCDLAQSTAEDFWGDWFDLLKVGHADHHEMVERSLLVLRALTDNETGGVVAAPTASLPEDFGGSRNWDYRYTWLRDAALTVQVMVAHGLIKGATGWRNWLIRAVAGDSNNLQIMYGLDGCRELPERELDHLAGYEGSRPVRIGNGAADQYQADVVGEVMLALAAMRDAGYADTPYSWALQQELLEYCIEHFADRDHGIWEMRGDLHYFTHGRVMMWAAFNEGIRAVEEHGLEGDVDKWKDYRERLRAEIWEHGFNKEINSFTQTYGSTEVDASLLQLPQTGFLAADDPAMQGTVARIERDLVAGDGLVYRYRTAEGLDGLEGHEYPFVMCGFWLAEQYAASGRIEDAERCFNALTAVASDLGLMAEEYDPATGRMAGNYPQAFSHLALIRAADAIAVAQGSKLD